jgi:large subunit ribosomal protein L29
MAILKMKEIRKMKPEDLNTKLKELKLELLKEMGNVKMGRPIKNTGKIRELKKAIARILTFQKELALKRK